MRIAVLTLRYHETWNDDTESDYRELWDRVAQYHEVKLFAPIHGNSNDQIEYDSKIGLEIENIPLSENESNRFVLSRRFYAAVKQYTPDLVVVSDGWFFKPWLSRAMEQYRFIVVFCGYEALCFQNHGTFFNGDQTCYQSHIGNIFINYPICHGCGLAHIIKNAHHGTGEGFHDYINALAFLPSYRRAVRRMIRKAHQVIVPNRLLGNILSDYSNRIHIVPAAVDPLIFPSLPQREIRPIRIGMIEDTADPKKGYYYLRRAFFKLLELGYDVELWLAAEPNHNFPALPQIQFRGIYHRDTLYEFFQDVDICVFPSIWQEPFYVPVLASMASARPVIVTQVGDLQDIVQHGETGFVVSAKSADQIAAALTTLINNPDLRNQMGQRGADIVRESFTWDNVVNQYYLPILESAV